jgi:fatty-acyl-CoA synthase
LTDPEFAKVIKGALDLLPGKKPIVIDVMDAEYESQERVGTLDYDQLLADGDAKYNWSLPEEGKRSTTT